MSTGKSRKLAFQYGDAKNFAYSLIDSGHAIPYIARADPPTVTLPRIKALTTGRVPSFLDAVYNIFDVEKHQESGEGRSNGQILESWVTQLKYLRNKRVAFAGDDTWLRLFPGVFDHADGTTSFFVSVS